MLTKRIRKLLVEEVSNSASETTKHILQAYVIGSTRSIPILNDKSEIRTISNITQNEHSFSIFLAKEETEKEWKCIPKTHKYQIEYFINDTF